MKWLKETEKRARVEAALRESEAFRRQIIDSSHDCIKIIDREGVLQWISERGLNALECEDIGCLVGRSWADTWPDAMRTTVAEAVAAAAGGVERRFFGWSPTLKGTDKYWDVIVTPLASDNGRPERLLAVSRDLTEHRRADEALRESEEKLRLLFDIIDEGYCIMECLRDDSGAVVDLIPREVNRSWEEKTGIPNPLGQRISELLPNLEDHWLPYYEEVIRTGVPVRHENYMQDVDRWFSAHYSLVGELGSNSVAVVFDDITERRRTDAALRESEAHLAKELEDARVLQEISNQLVSEGGPNGHYNHIVEVARTLMRSDAASIQELDADSRLKLLAHTGFHAESAAFWAYVDADVGSSCGRALTAHNRIVVPDMDKFDADPHDVAAYRKSEIISVQSTPLVASSGRIVGMMSTHWNHTHIPSAESYLFFDILARLAADFMERARAEQSLRESEVKYRSLFETMGQGYAEMEMIRGADGRATDLRYIDLNPAYERLTGIHVANALGRTVREVIPNFDDWWIATYDRIVRGGQPERVEYEVAALGRWYEAHVHPRSGERFVVFYEEITERKRAEIALRESEERKEFLLKLSDALRGERDADAVAALAVRLLADELRVDRCYIVGRRQGEDLWHVGPEFRLPGVPALPPVLDQRDFPEALRLITEQTLVIDNTAEQPGMTDLEKASLRALGFGSLLMAVLRRGERNPTWSMVASSTQPRRWTSSEIKLAEDVAERTWAAVERARAEAALANDLRIKTRLNTLAERLLSTLDLSAGLGEVLDAALDVFGTKRGTTQILDPEEDVLRYAATRSFDEKLLAEVPPINRDFHSTCGACIRTGERVVASDIVSDPHWADHASTACALGYGAAYSAPMKTRKDELLGVLTLHFEKARTPSESELRWFDSLAQTGAHVIERARAEAALRESEEKFRSLFAASPAPFLIVKPDAPRFTIIEVNDAYLAATMRTREQLVGRGIFEAFPDNPGDANIAGVRTLRASLEHVLANRQQETLPHLKYDVVRPDGAFEERWWSPVNSPLLGENGKVEAIIHNAIDVTEEHRAGAALRASEASLARELANTKQLQKISSILIEGEDDEALYGHILDAAMAIMRSDFASLQKFDPESSELRLLGHRNFHPDSAKAWERISITTSTPCGGALDEGERLFVPDCCAYDVEGAEYFRLSGIMSCQSTPLTSRDGRLIGMMSTHWRAEHTPTEEDYRSFDILVRQTADAFEQVGAEAALRESEERYRELFERIDEGFCIIEMIFDGSGRAVDYLFVKVNPAFERQTGIVAAEGRRMREIAPDHEEHWFKNFGEVALTGKMKRFEAPAKRLDDRYFELQAYRVGDPRQMRVAIVFSDITQRQRHAAALRESEERYQSLFASSPVPFMVLAPNPPDYTILAANDAYFAATLTTRKTLIGRRLFDVFTDDPSRPGQLGSEALAISLDRVLTTRRKDAMKRVRYDIVTPDGRFEEHWWLAINAPMLDADGNITAIIHQVDRQTERHFAEEAERESQERQELLVAELQHRTFNLMSMIRSTADVTLRSSASLDDFQTKFSTRIAALARVQRLLSRLKEDDRVTFDEMIRAELEAVGALQDDNGRVLLDGPEGVALRSSTVQTLAMAIHELTTNAVKYGALKQAGARLDIRWRVEAQESRQPWLHVDWRETGVSMPPINAVTHGTGQGRTLIEQALPYQLNAKTTYIMGNDGVHCSIALPVSARTSAKAEHGAS